MRTLDNVVALIKSIKSRPEHSHEKRSREHPNELLFEEFDSYLTSRENSVFDPECDAVYHVRHLAVLQIINLLPLLGYDPTSVALFHSNIVQC